ncbi:MAG TPA: sugar ABC transporter ATP-binding protein [Spongiibacteraceae bacterium]|nr:sugar ABC transporter ATP-binding protein [Spongiibacteraceae bacterium]HCS26532.1 sugar ABC transporter ATP-binding protein [Spongiibacteraceae bacterium]
MSSSEVVINVDSVSKIYHVYQKPVDRLKQFVVPGIMRLLRRNPASYFKEFCALKEISFTVKKGEIVGVIGRNGAGKSTLLQILARTVTPTSGQVEVVGRVAALLELGAGFNVEFTGRENVVMNGVILGLSSEEVLGKFDEIAEFADIGDFIDQPVKTYSSGMYVRLAFAVSVCLKPDILIVDEALAVGDARFQAKCFRRFDELVEQGTTILLVTHSTEQIVRHCDRAILVEQGAIFAEGVPKDIANLYMDLLFGAEGGQNPPQEIAVECERSLGATPPSRFELRAGYNPTEYRWGDSKVEIVDFVLSDQNEIDKNVFRSGTKLSLHVWVLYKANVAYPVYGLTIKTPDGVIVYGCNSRDFIDGPIVKPMQSGRYAKVVFDIDLSLGGGEYLVSLGVAEDISGEVFPLDRRYDSILMKVLTDDRSVGIANLNMKVSVE